MIIKYPHKYLLYGEVVTITKINYFFIEYTSHRGTDERLVARPGQLSDIKKLLTDVDTLTDLEKIVYGI